MTAPHTAALNTALAVALDHALAGHADEVCFGVLTWDGDGHPTRFVVTAYRGFNQFAAEDDSKDVALDLAMVGLRAAIGGAA